MNCSMTILGDKAQTVDDRMQDVLRFLPKILGKDMRRIEMNKSYRNTAEIAQYAQKVTHVKGVEYVNRHGKPVTEYDVSVVGRESQRELEDVVDQILSTVNLGDEGFETAAVLTMTDEEAVELYCALKARREEVSYINRDSSTFKKGITVTTFYMAKGLEFDQVYVVGGEKDNPFYKQFQYICATRALHELHVFQ